MYIIMYKYSAFRINHKSFRSSMSKNFTVIPGSDRGSHSEQERYHPLPALIYFFTSNLLQGELNNR